MNYCVQCGQPLAPGARFCSSCGAAVAPPPESPWAPPLPVDPVPGFGPLPVDAAPGLGPVPPGPFTPPIVPLPMAGGPPIAPPPPHAVFTTTPAPVATQRVEYAGFWRRFWGLFIDRFALGFVLLPIQLAMGLHMVWPFTTDGEMTPERLMAIVFGSISMLLIRTFAEWVYFAVFQSSARQATLGQMALGIRVTDRHGQRIGFARASGRYFASWVSNLTLGIGYIICVFSERRQTLHDMIAGTLVVRSSGSA